MFKNPSKYLASVIIAFLPLISFAEKVSLEIKKVDDGVAIVFYHDRWNGLTPGMVGLQGRVRAEKSFDIKYISDISDILDVVPNSSKNIFDFKLKPNYKFNGTIYGENLVAFKASKVKLKQPAESKNSSPTQKIKTDTKTKASDVTVGITNNKNSKRLSFPFAAKDVGAAIFKRDKSLWLVFDTRRDFFIGKAGFIESTEQYNDPHNTIVKIRLKDNFSPTIFKNGKNWVVSLKTKSSNKGRNLSPEFIGDGLVSFKSIGTVKNIVTVRDEEVGDILKIVPVKSTKLGSVKAQSNVDYKILESSIGIAISLTSDYVKTSYNKNTEALDIISTYSLASKDDGKNALEKYESILPLKISEIEAASFTQTKLYLQDMIIYAKNKEEKAKAIAELGKFFFTHEMYQEAIGAFERSKNLSEKTSNTKENLLMKAVALTLTNQALDARDVYTHLKQNYAYNSAIQEVKLWDAYNEFSLGNKNTAINFHGNKLIESYPDKVYFDLAFADLDILYSKKDAKAMDLIIKSLKEAPNQSIKNFSQYHQARYFYLLNQVNLSQNLLEEIKTNATNGKEYLIAELQLVKVLYEQKRLDWISAVQRLSQLRFVWRGDKYEQQLLMAMGIAYQQNHDVINAIRTYKYINDSFGSSAENNFFITSQIVDLYSKIFLSNEMQELDDFSVVALFYEFKDYVPIGQDGDRVVLGIARRMLNLDLLEMASGILEHQVMYRLRGVERMVTANHLALVLLMDRKPKEALRVLNDTDNENFGFMEHHKRTLLKSKALIDMKMYDDALSYIGSGDDPDSSLLKSEIFFKSMRWGDYISFVGPKIRSKLKEGDVIKGETGQEVLRLAIAYSMLNRLDDLAYIEKSIITENKELKSILSFLKSSNTPIDPHRIDEMMGVDSMKNFLDNYRQLLFN